MNLREATRDSHDRAENLPLSKLMISGTMREHTFAAMIENMMQIYAELERDGMITKNEVLRYSRLRDDLQRMGGNKWPTAQSVTDYVLYLRGLDTKSRWAHVYVHYLGNMYGGQMLRKSLPFATSHLEFDDIKGCVSYVRENLIDVDPAEANRAFDWTMRVYDELYQLFG